MDPLFKDLEKQKKFEQDGYLAIPLLSPHQVDMLRLLFESTQKQHATVADLHHTTTDTQDAELIYQVDAEIKNIFIAAVDQHLINYKPLAATFHIKEPGIGSSTGLHQDPTFVDEAKYVSANIWVALQDTNEHNGNLYFIKGSNRLIHSLRITPYSSNYYDTYTDELMQSAKNVPLKKGEAVIFNNSTIHGATENLSPDVRLAATLLVSSAQAQWLIYYRERDQPSPQVDEYHLTLDEFIRMPKNGRPSDAAFSRKLDYIFPSLSLEEYKAKMGDANPRKGAFSKLFDMINSL